MNFRLDYSFFCVLKHIFHIDAAVFEAFPVDMGAVDEHVALGAVLFWNGGGAWVHGAVGVMFEVHRHVGMAKTNTPAIVLFRQIAQVLKVPLDVLRVPVSHHDSAGRGFQHLSLPRHLSIAVSMDAGYRQTQPFPQFQGIRVVVPTVNQGIDGHPFTQPPVHLLCPVNRAVRIAYN